MNWPIFSLSHSREAHCALSAALFVWRQTRSRRGERRAKKLDSRDREKEKTLTLIFGSSRCQNGFARASSAAKSSPLSFILSFAPPEGCLSVFASRSTSRLIRATAREAWPEAELKLTDRRLDRLAGGLHRGDKSRAFGPSASECVRIIIIAAAA